MRRETTAVTACWVTSLIRLVNRRGHLLMALRNDHGEREVSPKNPLGGGRPEDCIISGRVSESEQVRMLAELDRLDEAIVAHWAERGVAVRSSTGNGRRRWPTRPGSRSGERPRRRRGR